MAQSITCSGQIGSKGSRLLIPGERGGGGGREIGAGGLLGAKVRVGAGGGGDDRLARAPSGPKSESIRPPDPQFVGLV